jgi:hypothetical protein
MLIDIKISLSMQKFTTKLVLIVISMLLLTGCKDYLKFEMTRYFSGFFISLAIGVVGLLIMSISKGQKNDRK